MNELNTIAEGSMGSGPRLPSRRTRAPRIRVAGHALAPLLVVLFGLALFLRIAYTAAVIDFADSPVTGDGPDYDNIATHLIAGDGFVQEWSEQDLLPYEDDPDLHAILAGRLDHAPLYSVRPPGYPLFLAGIYAVSGRDFGAARLVQIIFDSLSVVLVALLGLRWHSRRAGLIAGFMAAFNPLLIYYSRMLTAETISTLLVLVIALLVTSYERTSRPRTIFAGGIALGMLLMLKSAFLLFAPALAAMLAWRHLRTPRRALAAVILLTLGSVAVVGPWILRNETIHGSYLISTQGGSAFAQRNNEVLADTPSCYGSWCPQTIAGAIPDSASEKEKDFLAWQIGFDFVRHHPADFAKLAFYRVLRAFNPVPVGLLRGDSFSEHYAGKVFGYAWVFPCFVLGFLLAWRRAPLARDFSLAFLGGMTCMLILASSGHRFILPGIPLMLIYAGVTVSALAEFYKGGLRFETLRSFVRGD